MYNKIVIYHFKVMKFTLTLLNNIFEWFNYLA